MHCKIIVVMLVSYAFLSCILFAFDLILVVGQALSLLTSSVLSIHVLELSKAFIDYAQWLTEEVQY